MLFFLLPASKMEVRSVLQCFLFSIFWSQCICMTKVLDTDLQEKLLKQSLAPVILVPGDGGCQVQGKWSKPTTVGYFCAKNEAEWTDLWLSISELSPYAIYCFVDNVRLVYNRDNRSTSNSPGVETRIPGFGGTDTVDWLDTAIHAGITEYFSGITENLVKMGYEKNVTVRGAPFDFRKAPNELHGYFSDLQSLIEDTYKINNNLKVVLIAHSMGAPILHAFLNDQLQTWKDKYIQSIISLSGAWGGSIKPIKVYAIGDNLGSRLLSAYTLRSLQISFPSLAFVMPSQELWGSPEDILITTPERNYTIFDIAEYFTALNYSDGYEMYKNTKDILYKVAPPQVEIHCLHGLQVPTTERLFYPTMKDFPWSPTLLEGDGDGTVNQRSLELCLKWARKQKQNITHKIFPKVDHMQILTDKGVLDYISQYLSVVQINNAKLLKDKQKPSLKSELNIQSKPPSRFDDGNSIKELLKKWKNPSNPVKKAKEPNLMKEQKDSSLLKIKLWNKSDMTSKTGDYQISVETNSQLNQKYDSSSNLNDKFEHRSVLPHPSQSNDELLIKIVGIGT